MTKLRRNAIDEWVSSYAAIHSPTWARRLSELISTYDQAILQRSLESVQLRKFVDAARMEGRPSELASELLGELAENFDNAQEAVVELSENSQARVRVNALVAMHCMTPTNRVLGIYRRALSDKSGRIRALASDHAMQRGLTALLDDINLAVDRECSEPIRQQLCRARDLLTEGIHTWADCDGRTMVTKKAADGSLITKIS